MISGHHSGPDASHSKQRHSLVQMPAIIRRMLESFRKNSGSLDGAHHSSWLTTMLPTTSNHQPPDEVVRAGKILRTHGFFLDRVINRCDHSGLVERYIFAQHRFSIVIDCGNEKYRIRFIAPPSGRMTFISNDDSWELAPSSLEDGIERLFPRSEENQNSDGCSPQIVQWVWSVTFS